MDKEEQKNKKEKANRRFSKTIGTNYGTKSKK